MIDWLQEWRNVSAIASQIDYEDPRFQRTLEYLEMLDRVYFRKDAQVFLPMVEKLRVALGMSWEQVEQWELAQKNTKNVKRS